MNTPIVRGGEIFVVARTQIQLLREIKRALQRVMPANSSYKLGMADALNSAVLNVVDRAMQAGMPEDHANEALEHACKIMSIEARGRGKFTLGDIMQGKLDKAIKGQL